MQVLNIFQLKTEIQVFYKNFPVKGGLSKIFSIINKFGSMLTPFVTGAGLKPYSYKIDAGFRIERSQKGY